MAAWSPRHLREGEVWMDCAAARRIYDEVKPRIRSLNKILSENGFGSGPLSRIRGTDLPKQAPKSFTKMRQDTVARFAKTCGVRTEQLLVGGTGQQLPAEAEDNTQVPTGLSGTSHSPATPTSEAKAADVVPRAWISIVQAEVASPLIFTEADWGRLTIRFLLGNVGNDPESFVTAISTIFPFEAERSPRDALDAICEQQPIEGQGFTLFPGEKRHWTNNIIMDSVAADRVRTRASLSKHKVNVLLAGCASYRSAGDTTIHKTPFLYGVYQTVNAELVGFDFAESAIAPEKLSLHSEARWLREPS